MSSISQLPTPHYLFCLSCDNIVQFFQFFIHCFLSLNLLVTIFLFKLLKFSMFQHFFLFLNFTFFRVRKTDITTTGWSVSALAPGFDHEFVTKILMYLISPYVSWCLSCIVTSVCAKTICVTLNLYCKILSVFRLWYLPSPLLPTQFFSLSSPMMAFQFPINSRYSGDLFSCDPFAWICLTCGYTMAARVSAMLRICHVNALP